MGSRGETAHSTPDDTTIDTAQEHELRRWAETLGVSPDTVREAVVAVGPTLGAVRRYLATASGNNAPDPNIGRQITGPGPDRSSPFSDAPEIEGMGQGGQPPHQSPGQRPPDPAVQDQMAPRRKQP